MVGYRRNYISGGTYFFTLALQNRTSEILIEKIELFKEAIHTVKLEHPFNMKAYVILPDHLHTLWELPEDDFNYSVRWQKIKTRFSKAIINSGIVLNKTKHNEYDLWQRRFWEHTVRDQQDFENHVNYIHYNPIKHGLVDKLEDWPYSSFHHFVKTKKLPPNWAEKISEKTAGINLYVD